MDVKLKNSVLEGKVNAVASKSYLHRALIAAALSDSPTEVIGKNASADVLATVGALKTLGAEILTTEHGYWVTPIAEPCEYAEINARESGSTLRFLLPVSAIITAKSVFFGEGRLAERPISELLSTLMLHGVTVNGERLPFTISGTLSGGRFEIDGNISSQYISGLLFALPLLSDDSEIVVKGAVASESYIKITLDVLRAYNIKIEQTETGYFVKGGQKYVSPIRFNADGDWSNAAFWLVGAAIGGNVTVENLDIDSIQGDKAAVEFLKKMGAKVEVGNDFVTVKKSKLSGIAFDVSDTPDLAPIMAIAGASATGKTVITGVDRLLLKESDRLSATMNMLTSFGVECAYKDNTLTINGGKLSATSIDGVNDHRMVMSAAIAAVTASGVTEISTAEAVNKSYPEFFKDYASLGGKIL